MIWFVIYILLFIILAVWRPKWALFLIFLLLPTYQIRFQVVGLPTTLLEVMIVILFVSWLIKQSSNLTAKRLIDSLGRWVWLILLWLVIGLIAIIVSPDKWGALGFWRAYFLEPILLLVVIIDFASSDTKTRIHASRQQADPSTSLSTSVTSTSLTTFTTILFGLSVSALICSIWAIIQKITNSGMASIEAWQYPLIVTVRPTGFFPQPNFLGMFLGPLSILFLGQFLINFKKRFIIYGWWFLAFLLSVVAIIFARSEGAIIGILAAIIFICLVIFRPKWRVALIILLLVISYWLLVASPWRQQLITKITFHDISSQLRLNIWRGAIDLIKTHPFFGVGLRGYQELISFYQKPFYLPGISQPISEETHPYPHNLFLALWTELGVLGLLTFLLIIFQFFYDGFKKIIPIIRAYPNAPNNSDGRVCSALFGCNFLVFNLAAMVVIIVHGCVDTPYFKNDLSILFWLIIGLMIIYQPRKK